MSLAQDQRFGCAACYQTLDSRDPSVGRNHFAECSTCRALYHDSCVPERCESAGCESTQFGRRRIAPPLELDFSARAPLSHRAGGASSITDEPLGVSSGTIPVEGGATMSVSIRNNALEPIEVPRWTGPPWAFIDLGGGRPADTRRLQPERRSQAGFTQPRCCPKRRLG